MVRHHNNNRIMDAREDDAANATLATKSWNPPCWTGQQKVSVQNSQYLELLLKYG